MRTRLFHAIVLVGTSLAGAGRLAGCGGSVEGSASDGVSDAGDGAPDAFPGISTDTANPWLYDTAVDSEGVDTASDTRPDTRPDTGTDTRVDTGTDTWPGISPVLDSSPPPPPDDASADGPWPPIR